MGTAPEGAAQGRVDAYTGRAEARVRWAAATFTRDGRGRLT